MCAMRRLICLRAQLQKERYYCLQIIYRNGGNCVPGAAKSEDKWVPCRIISGNQLSTDVSKQTSSRGVIKYQLRFFAKVCCYLRPVFFQVHRSHLTPTATEWCSAFLSSFFCSLRQGGQHMQTLRAFYSIVSACFLFLNQNTIQILENDTLFIWLIDWF